ncbi:MAG: hypothetical protein Q9225_004007 [Loekoesia sp. 1 TL-2023]
MAAGYAIPASVQDADHLHSHNRKLPTHRLPFDSGPTKGMNGGPIKQEDNTAPTPFRCHLHSDDPSTQTSDCQCEIHDEDVDSTSQLPPPKFASIKPGNSRPKSMQRRISVGLPTHLRLQGKGYGVPAARKPNLAPPGDVAARKWITFTEFFSSILIALSFVFVSIFHDHIALHLGDTNQSPADKPLTGSVHQFSLSLWIGSLQISSLFLTLAITAATLMLSGLVGKTQMSLETIEQSKGSLKSSEKRTSQSSRAMASNARKIIEKVFGVALPIHAASCLGGARVALVMLVALFSRIVTLEDGGTTLADMKGWKQIIKYRRWTLMSILAQALFDFVSYTTPTRKAVLASGFLALTVSIVVLPPPFPSIIRATPGHSEINPASGSVVLSSGFEAPSIPEVSSLRKSTVSSLVSSPEEMTVTLQAGLVSATLCVLLWFMSNLSVDAFNLRTFSLFSITAFTTAACLLVAQPQSLQENRGLGILTGALTSSVVSYLFHTDVLRVLGFEGILVGFSFLATQIDTPTILASRSKASQHHNAGHHYTTSHSAHSEDHSRLTRFLLETFQHRPLLHNILVEKDSRRIFYFMSLNFSFMLVQFFYGIATGSLGLLSDSVHMFFDCLALVVGLCAAVMSKWPPSPRFPYGYGKIDTLAGFANGIFLMLISLEIVYEAIERLVEGSEMQRIGELLTVSTLGLVVNLAGVTAFGHAHHGHSHHGHSHHGHSHHDHAHHNHGHGHTDNSKSHENHDHHHPGAVHDHDQPHEHDAHLHTSPNPSPYSSVPATPSKPVHLHSHACEDTPHHHHGHGNENMQGIYLHVLADTLGSVAVVISTLLIHFYGWSGFDPLASCLIAILIFASAVPLVKSTAKKLLLTIPEDVEFDLREALAGVSALKGVIGYAAPKFWLDEGEERKVIGVIHITAAKGVDMEDLKNRAVAFLRSKNMNVIVQVEREGVNRCWCKAKAG